MKYLLVFLGFSIYNSSFAQNNYVKEIRLTETAFALEAQIKGVKQGFLNNLHTSAIGINRTGFTNLYNIWDKRANSNFILLWEPKSVYASSDGLFGITDGPSYTIDSAANTLKHTGYFFSIWERKNLNTPYKILLDAGAHLDMPLSKDSASALAVKEFSISSKSNKSIDTSVANAFTAISQTTSLLEALNKNTTTESDILLSGSGKYTKKELVHKTIFLNQFQFQKVATKVLGNSNAFFEYGSLSENNNKPNRLNGYYVHVWITQENKPVLIAALYRLN